MQVLTEENLEQIDELYKMVSPARDASANYTEALAEASEHIISLLDARDKPVVGNTYKVPTQILDYMDIKNHGLSI